MGHESMGERLLPSWRDGATRDAIIGFLDNVEQIPPDDRVAVFDNDGTMWAEKPNYTQLDFMLHEVGAAVAARPELAEEPAYRAVVEHDMATMAHMGLEAFVTSLLDLFVGLTPDEFDAKVANIQRILGRAPCVAGGNSAGDTEMLEPAMAYNGPSLAVLVDHDDAEREYAYESVAGTFSTDESIIDTAARLGWTVASIKNDRSTVFAHS